MAKDEIVELFQRLTAEHGCSAAVILQAIMMERLGKRIESALAQPKGSA